MQWAPAFVSFMSRDILKKVPDSGHYVIGNFTTPVSDDAIGDFTTSRNDGAIRGLNSSCVGVVVSC